MANPHKYYYYGIRVHGIYSVSCFGPLAAGSKKFQLGVWYESISNWLLLIINGNNNFQLPTDIQTWMIMLMYDMSLKMADMVVFSISLISYFVITSSWQTSHSKYQHIHHM